MNKFILLSILVLLAGCTTASRCGVQECHGLDITCGPNVPQVCTEIYMLGDFCRAYINCSTVNGACSLELNDQFTSCKNCVSECTGDAMEAFDCEAVCRTKMDKYCEIDSDCACGRNIDTGECFYGSAELVNTGEQCPDYCTGIAGNLEIRCVNNECAQLQR